MIGDCGNNGVNHPDRPGANQWTLTFSSRSPWDSGTSTRWTTQPGGSGWTDPRMEHLRDIHHVPEFQRLEIQHFFEVYKAIEPGKEVRTEAWADRRAAEAEIEACRKRFAEAEEHGEAGAHGGVAAGEATGVADAEPGPVSTLGGPGLVWEAADAKLTGASTVTKVTQPGTQRRIPNHDDVASSWS